MLQSSGVPKTTLMFGNSLEALLELKKGIILMAMVHFSKRTQRRISQGKKHPGRIWERPRHRLLIVLPQQSCSNGANFQ